MAIQIETDTDVTDINFGSEHWRIAHFGIAVDRLLNGPPDLGYYMAFIRAEVL